MIDRLKELEAEFDQVLGQLAIPEVLADQEKLKQFSKRHRELEPIVQRFHLLNETLEEIEVCELSASEASGDELQEWQALLSEAEERRETLEAELKELLLPRDPLDDRAVIVEIRGAEGGEEANIFARDLYDMYLRFASRLGWRSETLSSAVSERGGFNEVVVRFEGDRVWSRMKHEAGPHRVQRVPVTESQGRIHTSSATVIVLPEAEEVDVQIDPNDLRVDVFRSSGPGGQSVNTTDSAVRITHLPTGMVVSMQDEKSQLQNRQRAMQVLRSRLYEIELERQAEAAGASRRSQIGGGGRGEKIRTYNFKENRVTDHRIGLTLYKLDRVLGEGDLDDVSDALVAADRAAMLETAG